MGWIDNSKFDLLNLTPLFTEGEAADICGTGDVPTDPVRLDNGIMVATYWSNADNGCVPFPTADLEVTKTDSPDPVIAGEQLYYTLTVTNHGPNDVPDASLSDKLPSQVEFVTDDRGVCTEGPTARSRAPRQVLNGATSTVVVKVKVKANAVSNAGHPFGMTNSAEIASVNQDPTPRTTRRRHPRSSRTGGPAGDEALQARHADACREHRHLHDLVDNLGSSDARNVTSATRT